MHLACIRFFKHLASMKQKAEELIKLHTVISKEHLTPEISLRLITSDCSLWCTDSKNSPFPGDPYWAFYWPGGQALSRYILDNKAIFYRKNVLDIGSGSGACALAAAKSAKHVIANDIDIFSCSAINLNAQINNTQVTVSSENVVGKDVDTIYNVHFDIVLVGDMFYDNQFSQLLFSWLCNLNKRGKTVLIGDPGRTFFNDISSSSSCGNIVKVCEYKLTSLEYYGYSTAGVYRVSAK